jgi:hypothetical protein
LLKQDFQTNGKENLTKNLLLSQKNDFSPAKVLNNSFINSILYDKKKQTRFFFIVKQMGKGKGNTTFPLGFMKFPREI